MTSLDLNETVVGRHTWIDIVHQVANAYDVVDPIDDNQATRILVEHTPWPDDRRLPVVEAALHHHFAQLEASRR
jgi:hypothetical protein